MMFYSGFSQAEDYMQSSLVQLNQNIPKFNFIDSEGKTVSIDDYKGKVILINFFATWCGPCMTEMPYLQNDIWNTLKDNKQFIILSFGRDHNQKEIDKFIDTKKIPRNYLVDQNGKVVYASTGFSTEEFEQMKVMINTLLK